MNGDESLEHVKRLLGLLPGVTLAWGQVTKATIRLGLVISDPRSVSLLAHVAVSANIPLHVDVAWGCPGGHDDPACVRYDLRVPVEQGPFEPPSNLQLFNGLLARKLKDRGALPSQETDHLLRTWNFAVE
jgi:hypothetical protein